MFLKNTSGQFVYFTMINVTTGAPVTGITPTCRRCIDGTFAAATGTITEDTGLGFYKMALSQADTNGNNIGYRFIGTGAIDTVINIVTTSLNPYDATRFGMAALPNANAEAAGGLYTRGTGAGQINQDANGRIDSNLLAILGTTLTETAGQIAAAFKQFFNIASPTSTMNTITAVTTATTATNLTNAPTNGDFTAAMKTSLNASTPASITGAVGSVTGNVGGNVTGSVGSVVGAVGSVTGAVGSVTGNVGGNVVGTVASVVGAVASVTGNVGGNVVGSVASVTAGVTVTTNNDKTGYALSADARITKNVALSNFGFLMVDGTDFATPKTGLVITATISKDGAAFGACSNAAVEISNGWYKIALTQTEMNADVILLTFTGSGAAARNVEIITQPAL